MPLGRPCCRSLHFVALQWLSVRITDAERSPIVAGKGRNYEGSKPDAAESNRKQKDRPHTQTLALPYIAATDSLTAGAKAARINRTTLHRWMHDPVFRAELERMRKDAEALARVELQGLVLKSINTLAELLEDPNPRVRAIAVRAVLSNALKVGDLRELRHEIETLQTATALLRFQR